MTEQKSTQKVSYLVTALIHNVKIQTKNSIQSKIRWKRRQSKAQTKVIKSDKQFLYFEEALALPFTFIYDKKLEKYVDKNTDIYCIVVQGDVLKHGGEAKYNVSQILNDHLENKKVKIDLINSPDKTAYIEISFSFQRQYENGTNENSIDVSQSTENGEILLENNSSIHENYGKPKQNIINNRSFLKDKSNTNNNKTSLSEFKQQMLQDQNKQLKDKIQLMERALKDTSLEVQTRDKQIVELREVTIPQIKRQLKIQQQKNKQLEGKIFQYEQKQQQKQLGSVIDSLKSQLSESKLSIGNIINTADDIGGSELVSQLFASIGVSELLIQ